ncbi:MAG: hypothetical protein K9J17_09715 [Flavobacteriales bacterium]|nr:hypothetical protein [Flavobacteriales bacterium]
MDLFKSRLDGINNIIQGNYPKSYSQYDINLSRSVVSEGIQKGMTGIAGSSDTKVSTKVNYEELETLYGTHRFSFSEPHIGPHPDFAHLGHNDYLNHYAVSMFIDIKGSTFLSNKYDLLRVRLIKDTILTLAIEVCSFFGGHIQRLQGDGVFVYFVRSEMDSRDAVINALNASSLLTYMMRFKVAEFFERDGVNAPGIRVGIDYGPAEMTLWSYYGLAYCNELTTTGLHTDLAAKLQAKASHNGIMLGQNVIQELDLTDALVSFDSSELYIFNNSYRMYEFKWADYLKSFDFFKNDSNGRLVMEPPVYKLRCEIAENENAPFVEYHQNLYSIPKDYKVRFTLLENGHEYTLKTAHGESIKWEINNSGKEAKDDNKPIEVMKDSDNQTQCEANAKYLGHHYMRCRILRSGSITNVNVKFPVFVR